MKITLAVVGTILAFGLASKTYAQFPGQWEKFVVCTHCMPPAELDFQDSATGVIALVSQKIARAEIPFWARTLVTHDAGSTWQMNGDTAFLAVLHRDLAKLYAGRLIILSRSGTTTFYSDDFGVNLELLRGDNVDQLDVFSVDPSTLFRASRIDRGRFESVDILVSRDSGISYSLLSNLEDTSYKIRQFRFRDTSEYWIILSPRTDLKPLKRIKLLYTLDQGQHWIESFPIDTTGLDWGRATFGGGTYRTGYEGLIPSSTSANIYLINCNDRVGIAGETRYGVLYSTDQGKSWMCDSSHASYEEPYLDISMLRNPHGSTLWLVRADSQTVDYSSDNGAHWVSDSMTFRGNPIMNMLWKDSVEGYALTFTKDSTLTFWKYVNSASTVEHFEKPPTKFIKLPSSVITTGKLRVYAIQSLAGEMSVYDVLGRMVWSSNVNASSSETIELDVPTSAGVYFLKYSEGKGKQTVRYVRE